jgi:CDP-glucose 4,6-dehydratase
VSKLGQKIESNIGDVRDYDQLKDVFTIYRPEIVFHLAAQPIVRLSYADTKLTYDTNIGGTVNLLECCRLSESVKVIINVTSDKCYENKEWLWGYRENDRLGGHDPYSSSKACSELITSAYRRSFFKDKCVSTVRAGNVIGGGDWQQDRLIPDCITALKGNTPIKLRNPDSVRPWQYVLEPLRGYMKLAGKMWSDGKKYSGAWNFGPAQGTAVTVLVLVQSIIHHWGSGSYVSSVLGERCHESKMLSLDISKAVNLLGWKPVLSVDEAVMHTVEWYANPKPDYNLCVKQIRDYSEVVNGN